MRAASPMLLLLATLACSAAAATNGWPARQSLAITEVSIIDVAHDRAIGPRTVLVERGRIVAIGPSNEVPLSDDVQRIEGCGRFLIPGLVDLHVHLFNLSSKRPPNDWMFPLFVANGITAIRDMRADAESMTLVHQWRQQTDDGQLLAPRIIAAGIAVHGNSAQDAAQKVDAAADAGAEFIKVFSEVPAAHWRAILVAAKARGLPVVGHVPAGVALRESAEAGQRSDEHLMQAYEACSSIERQLLAVDAAAPDAEALVALRDAQETRALQAFAPAVCRRIARAIARTGQVQVPTLVLADEDALAVGGVASDDPRWRFLRADERLRWKNFLAGYTAQDAALARLRWPVAGRIVSILQRAGVPILAGTDSPMPGVYPGFSLHEELRLLVAAGLSPRQALRAATLSAAEFLAIADDVGSIAVGKRANLVLLDADPLRDIRNTQRIDAVMLDGRLLRRADLDRVLRDAAAAQSP